MKSATKLAPVLIFWGVVIVLVAWFSACPPPVAAQGSQGQDAVYNSSNGIVGSSSFIDASMFATSADTFCSTIYKILQPASYSAAVIDARGFPGTTGANMTCAVGWTPWNNGATYLNKPSTILLPATGGATPTPIIISTPWILPSNTHLIGEGDGIPSSGSTPGTTIQAKSGFSGSMIQFGSASASVCPLLGSIYTCTGISAENLTLDGRSQGINGITNGFAQDSSYVNHVSLFQILGTGLSVSGSANNSGPYSNITFDTGGASGLTSTVCASVNGLNGTRGIHGLSCNSETNDASAAVLLDASNNSIEDVRIVGFYDGIRVGKNGVAQSNAAGGQTC
jgi:hypothetical protein